CATCATPWGEIPAHRRSAVHRETIARLPSAEPDDDPGAGCPGCRNRVRAGTGQHCPARSGESFREHSRIVAISFRPLRPALCRGVSSGGAPATPCLVRSGILISPGSRPPTSRRLTLTVAVTPRPRRDLWIGPRNCTPRRVSRGPQLDPAPG